MFFLYKGERRQALDYNNKILKKGNKKIQACVL